MSPTLRAVHGGPDHQPASVDARAYRVLERLPETGPAGSALKFCIGREQLVRAPRALKDAGSVLLIQGTCERPLGGLPAKHSELRGGQCPAPFFLAVHDRKCSADRRRRLGEPPDDGD